jgi:hypothetical protein
VAGTEAGGCSPGSLHGRSNGRWPGPPAFSSGPHKSLVKQAGQKQKSHQVQTMKFPIRREPFERKLVKRRKYRHQHYRPDLHRHSMRVYPITYQPWPGRLDFLVGLRWISLKQRCREIKLVNIWQGRE